MSLRKSRLLQFRILLIACFWFCSVGSSSENHDMPCDEQNCLKNALNDYTAGLQARLRDPTLDADHVRRLFRQYFLGDVWSSFEKRAGKTDDQRREYLAKCSPFNPLACFDRSRVEREYFEYRPEIKRRAGCLVISEDHKGTYLKHSLLFLHARGRWLIANDAEYFDVSSTTLTPSEREAKGNFSNCWADIGEASEEVKQILD